MLEKLNPNKLDLSQITKHPYAVDYLTLMETHNWVAVRLYDGDTKLRLEKDTDVAIFITGKVTAETMAEILKDVRGSLLLLSVNVKFSADFREIPVLDKQMKDTGVKIALVVVDDPWVAGYIALVGVVNPGFRADPPEKVVKHALDGRQMTVHRRGIAHLKDALGEFDKYSAEIKKQKNKDDETE